MTAYTASLLIENYKLQVENIVITVGSTASKIGIFIFNLIFQ